LARSRVWGDIIGRQAQAFAIHLGRLLKLSLLVVYIAEIEMPLEVPRVVLDPFLIGAGGFVQFPGYTLMLGEVGRASEYGAKAFELREHASEREKLAITADYYAK
jgi:hypothetical protein